MKLTIVVTVLNEKNTIMQAIEDAKSLNIDKEIIVVDNCSTDGTTELLRDLKDSSIKIIFQPQNYGFGQSVNAGVHSALGEYIYIQYADLEYDINSVYGMVDLANKENLDAVFGSRYYYLNKNFFSILSMIKKRPHSLGSIVSTFLINLFYKKRFKDIIGSKLYRVSSFKKLNIKTRSVGFDFEVVSRLCKNGFLIKEVPVEYKPRGIKDGKKVKALDIIPALITIFRVKWDCKRL